MKLTTPASEIYKASPDRRRDESKRRARRLAGRRKARLHPDETKLAVLLRDQPELADVAGAAGAVLHEGRVSGA